MHQLYLFPLYICSLNNVVFLPELQHEGGWTDCKVIARLIITLFAIYLYYVPHLTVVSMLDLCSLQNNGMYA